MDTPPGEGLPIHCSPDGLRRPLGSRFTGAMLGAEVTAPDVAQAAANAEETAIMLSSVVPDSAVASIPLGPPPHLGGAVPLLPLPVAHAYSREPGAVRAREGLEGVLGPRVVRGAGTGEAAETLVLVGYDEVKPPGSHGGEMGNAGAPPASLRRPGPPTPRAFLVRPRGFVGFLGGRQNGHLGLLPAWRGCCRRLLPGFW